MSEDHADHDDGYPGMPQWSAADEPTVLGFLSGELAEDAPSVRELFAREPELRDRLLGIREIEDRMASFAGVESAAREARAGTLTPDPEDLAWAGRAVREHLGAPARDEPWRSPWLWGVLAAAALVVAIWSALPDGGDPRDSGVEMQASPPPVAGDPTEADVPEPVEDRWLGGGGFDWDALAERVERTPADAAEGEEARYVWRAPGRAFRFGRFVLFDADGGRLGEPISVKGAAWRLDPEDPRLARAERWLVEVSRDEFAWEPWAGGKLR